MTNINASIYLNFQSSSPPMYNLKDVKIGVIHMGLGAFHRAHQAVYFEKLLRLGNLGYGIASVSQRSEKEAATLSAQDCLYTVDLRDGDTHSPLIVGAIRKAYFYPSHRDELLEIAASSDLKVITLTVTEKAYRVDEIVPKRIIELLEARFRKGREGIAIISCDNLPSNGDVVRSILIETARNSSSDFLAWLGNKCRFPNSMVDRIVPAITEKSIAEYADLYEYTDRSLISTEPFIQWVIEDDLLAPDLSSVGVEFVRDVKQYEKMKICLFNGAHSALAYFSQISGFEFVADAIADPRIERFIRDLQELELAKSFDAPQGIDLHEYSQNARNRIANIALRHRSAQVAMDGSQKLPQRLFASAHDLHQSGLPSQRISFVIAAWIHFLAISTEVDDPLADELQKWAIEKDPFVAVSGILTIQSFATHVPQALFPEITHWLEQLRVNPLLDVIGSVGLKF